MKQLIASFKQVEMLTWQATLIVIALFLYFGPLYASLSNGSPRLNEQLVALIACSIYLVFVTIAKSTFLREKTIGDTPGLSLAALIFLCFLMSVGNRIISVEFFGQPLSTVSPTRVVAISFAVAIWNLTLALWIGQAKAHKREMQQLESDIHKLAALEIQSSQILQQSQARTISKIEETINAAWTKLNPGGKVSDQLLEMVNVVVRPLSREIAANEISKLEANFNKLFSVSIAKRLRRLRELLGELSIFDPVYTPIFLVALPYLSRTNIAEPLGAERSLLISYVIFLAMMIVGKKLDVRLRYFLGVNQRLAIAFGFWLLTAIADAAIFSVFFSRAGFATLPIFIFADLVVCVLFLTIRLVFEDRRQILEQMQHLKEKLRWLHARTQQLIWVEQQRLSNLVHGHMQAQITATAFRFEEQASPDSEQLLQNLYSELGEILANHNRTQPVQEFIESLKMLWGQSIVITSNMDIDVQHVLAADQDASDASVEIIREAITNAAKHARSKNVEIRLEIDNKVTALESEQGFIRIEIQNDGSELGLDFKAGSGLEFFNAVSSSWTLENFGGRVRLIALIPFSKS